MIRKNIPNFITLGNLLCGCLALIAAFGGDLNMAAYLVGIALILDFFDGFTARLLGVSSPIGKDLDSLADMVTFGVVPGMVMYQLIDYYSAPFAEWPNDIGGKPNFETTFVPEGVAEYLKYVALIIPLFSAVRLARFNNDTRQTVSFIGMPTPANAMVICSLPLIFESFRTIVPITENEFVGTYDFYFVDPLYLCIASIILSLLLVAPIPLFALKFKTFGLKGNELRYGFLILSLVFLILLKVSAVPLIILFYILLSIVNNIFSKKQV